MQSSLHGGSHDTALVQAVGLGLQTSIGGRVDRITSDTGILRPGGSFCRQPLTLRERHVIQGFSLCGAGLVAAGLACVENVF